MLYCYIFVYWCTYGKTFSTDPLTAWIYTGNYYEIVAQMNTGLVTKLFN